jgi:hypothetical protein
VCGYSWAALVNPIVINALVDERRFERFDVSLDPTA